MPSGLQLVEHLYLSLCEAKPHPSLEPGKMKFGIMLKKNCGFSAMCEIRDILSVNGEPSDDTCDSSYFRFAPLTSCDFPQRGYGEGGSYPGSPRGRSRGNELADKTAKETATEDGLEVAYNRKPKTTIVTEIEEEGFNEWENDWKNSLKGAICKKFFPSVRQRMKQNITLTAEVTAMISGHGKTKAYLHRFGIKDDSTCSCLQDAQTVDHLIYSSVKLNKQRDILKHGIYRNQDRWPVLHEKLLLKHYKGFRNFVQSIDFTSL
ncbi:hypothetical protein ANN_19885 [Periplaneta americana]|uniref:Uncharacterized protein n=1 Tax=Periplaneta americana TaxID=6978 RepID=A0ABQ8SBI1_PERAM|nr:hypothetical protein ANN_19885 [Periplaneta americana]